MMEEFLLDFQHQNHQEEKDNDLVGFEQPPSLISQEVEEVEKFVPFFQESSQERLEHASHIHVHYPEISSVLESRPNCFLCLQDQMHCDICRNARLSSQKYMYFRQKPHQEKEAKVYRLLFEGSLIRVFFISSKVYVSAFDLGIFVSCHSRISSLFTDLECPFEKQFVRLVSATSSKRFLVLTPQGVQRFLQQSKCRRLVKLEAFRNWMQTELIPFMCRLLKNQLRLKK